MFQDTQAYVNIGLNIVLYNVSLLSVDSLLRLFIKFIYRNVRPVDCVCYVLIKSQSLVQGDTEVFDRSLFLDVPVVNFEFCDSPDVSEFSRECNRLRFVRIYLNLPVSVVVGNFS